MRKRSKKRIPQDIKAWSRVIDENENEFFLPTKKKSRWTSGAHRDWNTRILLSVNNQNNDLLKTVIKRGIGKSSLTFNNNTVSKKISAEKMSMSKNRSLSKYKNFCLLSGKTRTYNKILLIARQQTRRLINIGALPGIYK